MESKEARKEAIRKFKERKPRLGAYAVRCTASGRVWVGSSRNLDATKNGSWTALRMGSHIEKPLQREWNEHGEPSFQYEILQVLDDDLQPVEVPDLLKAAKAHWIEQLHAQPLLP
jgi:hypothetical protein